MSKSEKTKTPGGLSIKRAGNKFTFSWKIAAKDHGDGQQVSYCEIPLSTGNTRAQSALVPDNDYKSIKKKKTSITKEVNFNKYYPKADKFRILVGVRFAVKGKQKDTKKDGKTIKYSWSEPGYKSFDIYPPNKPSVTSGLGQTSTKALFTWHVDADKDDHRPIVDCEWESLIVKDDMRPVSKGDRLNWSRPIETGTSDGSSGSKSFEHNDETLFQGDYCFTRWIRVRARGPGGPSGWTYKKLTFAMPNRSENVTVSASKRASGNTRCTVTWEIDTKNRPLSYAHIQYAIAPPEVRLSESKGKKVSTITGPKNPSWQDAPGGDSISDTAKKDSWTFDVDSDIADNHSLWVRVNSVYSVNPNPVNGVPVRAKSVSSVLSAPSITEISRWPANQLATVTVENGAAEEIPESFVAIYYRLASNQSQASCIGIIPSGETQATFQTPVLKSGDSIEFGVRAFVATYSPIQPKLNEVTKYSITSVLMQSSISWEDGSIPKPPKEVELTGISSESLQVNWDWSWTDADSAELSWSQNRDAWGSTDEPQTYIVSSLNAVCGDKRAQWIIAGLSPGTWYVRVRLMRSSDDATTYGTYSAIKDINLASAPAIPVLVIQPETVSEDESVTCTWAYVSTDGTGQSQADICVATFDNEGAIHYGPPLPESATGNAQSVTLQASSLGHAGDTVNLCVRVRSQSGETSEGWSTPASFHIATKPTIEIDDANTSITLIDIPDPDDPTEVREDVPSITTLPIDVAFTGSGENDDVLVTIVRHPEDSMHETSPDEETMQGFAGETIVYGVSGKVSDGSITITADQITGFLNDGGRFVLRVLVMDAYNQTNFDEREFEIHWEHQAIFPRANISVLSDSLVSVIMPLMPAPEEFPSGDAFEEGDYCEIYRLSVDRPVKIIDHAQFGSIYIDPYPTLGEYGGYRIVYRTKDGDYTTENDEHGKQYAWTDYGVDEGATLNMFATIIDFDGDRVILPYDLSLSHKWTKDFRQTTYLGGKIQGDWNPGVSLSSTVNTRVIALEDPDIIQSMRRLGDYAGVCNVRTPDGSSFHADVQVQEDYEERWINRIARFSLSITRIDPQGYDGMPISAWLPNEDEEEGE